jgi:hypothetical protein
VAFLQQPRQHPQHWHGATPPPTAMTHIAIQEPLNGKPVDWMEKVSDAEYQRKS